MSRKFLSPVAALALASFCGVSQAESISFPLPGFAHGSQTVTVNLASPNLPTITNKTVSAGGFLTSLNGGPTFESYCVDLYQTINFGALPYTDYSFAGLGHLFTNGNAYADLGRLYATAGVVNTAVAEAAFQIAVWEIAYEATGTAYNLGSGAATFAGSVDAISMATDWLDNLAASGPAITVMNSREHQDIIFVPIPEPETYALFMAGLAAVGFMARRRRKA